MVLRKNYIFSSIKKNITNRTKQNTYAYNNSKIRKQIGISHKHGKGLKGPALSLIKFDILLFLGDFCDFWLFCVKPRLLPVALISSCVFWDTVVSCESVTGWFLLFPFASFPFLVGFWFFLSSLVWLKDWVFFVFGEF